MDSRKECRKSASKWGQGSEKALLKVWSENVDELLSCRKNRHIILKMAATLQAQGYKYTVVELKTKMHNVTARYRKEKRRMATYGLPPEWDLFNEVELLLTPYNYFNSEGIVADNINNINSSIMYHPLLPTVTSPTTSSPLPLQSISSSSTHTSPSTAVYSPSSYMPADTPSAAASSTAALIKQEELEKLFKNLEESIEKINEGIKSTTDRMIAIEEEKKEMLKEYVDRESEVQQALIEFLKRS